MVPKTEIRGGGKKIASAGNAKETFSIPRPGLVGKDNCRSPRNDAARMGRRSHNSLQFVVHPWPVILVPGPSSSSSTLSGARGVYLFLISRNAGTSESVKSTTSSPVAVLIS